MSSGLMCLNCRKYSPCECDDPQPSWDGETPARDTLIDGARRDYEFRLPAKARVPRCQTCRHRDGRSCPLLNIEIANPMRSLCSLFASKPTN